MAMTRVTAAVSMRTGHPMTMRSQTGLCGRVPLFLGTGRWMSDKRVDKAGEVNVEAEEEGGSGQGEKPAEKVETQEQILFGRAQLEIKKLISGIEAVRANVLKRNAKNIDLDRFVELYREQQPLANRLITLQTQRNQNAEEIKQLSFRIKTASEEEALNLRREIDALIEKGKAQRLEIEQVKQQKEIIFEHLMEEAIKIPNLIHPSVPVGDESCARVVAYGPNRTLLLPPTTKPESVQAIIDECNNKLSEIEPETTDQSKSLSSSPLSPLC